MIFKLPKWHILNTFPGIYDTESLTAIEQTARIYGKINELIEDYNSWIDTIGETLNTYIEQSEEEHEAFKVGIRQEFQDFIDTINLKILAIEKEIADFESETGNKLTGFANEYNTFKKEIEGAMTELRQNIYIDLSDATIPLIVTIDNGVASHTPRDIYNTLTGGANVYLKKGNTYTKLNELNFDLEMEYPNHAYATFINLTEDSVYEVYRIAYDGSVSTLQDDIGGGSGGASEKTILYVHPQTTAFSDLLYKDSAGTQTITKNELLEIINKEGLPNVYFGDIIYNSFNYTTTTGCLRVMIEPTANVYYDLKTQG